MSSLGAGLVWGKNMGGNRSQGPSGTRKMDLGCEKTTVTTSCSGFSHLEIPAPKAGKVCSSGARLGNRFRPSQQTECASRAEEECLRGVDSQPRTGKPLFFCPVYQTSFVVWLETNAINPILFMYFHTLWMFQTIFDLNLFKMKGPVNCALRWSQFSSFPICSLSVCQERLCRVRKLRLTFVITAPADQ